MLHCLIQLKVLKNKLLKLMILKMCQKICVIISYNTIETCTQNIGKYLCNYKNLSLKYKFKYFQIIESNKDNKVADFSY